MSKFAERVDSLQLHEDKPLLSLQGKVSVASFLSLLALVYIIVGSLPVRNNNLSVILMRFSLYCLKSSLMLCLSVRQQ